MKFRIFVPGRTLVCLTTLLGFSLADCCLAAGDLATAYLKLNSEQPVILGEPTRRDAPLEFASFKATQEQFVTLSHCLRVTLRKPQVSTLASVREAEQKGEAEKWLAGMVKITFPGKAEIMAVTCTLPDRREAAILTNALVDTYLDELQDYERQIRTGRLSVLEKIASHKESELRNRHQELRKLTKMLGSDDAKASGKLVPVDVEMLQFDIKLLEELIREVRMELEHLKIELKAPSRVTLLRRAEVLSPAN